MTALALSGIGVAGCSTVPSDTVQSFAAPAVQALDFVPELLSSAPSEARDGRSKWAAVAPRPKPDSADRILLADVDPKIMDPMSPLQCVPFARDASGVNIRGDAKHWWKLAAGKYSRSRRPKEGSVFVMRGYQTARRGHVAVVRQILDSRTIVVDHANWGNDGRIYLNAPVRDESAKNDWSKVRVWYTPNDRWGQRVYRAKGFIHPTTAVADNSLGLGRN
jgi:surface antigen